MRVIPSSSRMTDRLSTPAQTVGMWTEPSFRFFADLSVLVDAPVEVGDDLESQLRALGYVE